MGSQPTTELKAWCFNSHSVFLLFLITKHLRLEDASLATLQTNLTLTTHYKAHRLTEVKL